MDILHPLSKLSLSQILKKDFYYNLTISTECGCCVASKRRRAALSGSMLHAPSNYHSQCNHHPEKLKNIKIVGFQANLQDLLPARIDHTHTLTHTHLISLYNTYRNVNLFLWYQYITKDHKIISKICFLANARRGRRFLLHPASSLSQSVSQSVSMSHFCLAIANTLHSICHYAPASSISSLLSFCSYPLISQFSCLDISS